MKLNQLFSALECNMGLSKWFLPFGHTYQDKTIWPNDQKMQICQPFNAFGVRYVDGFRIKVRGVSISFFIVRH